MAQKKTAKKSAASGSRSAKSARAQERPPIRREIWALICLVLGLFSFIGYFNVEGWFIAGLSGFVKGLIGWGYYIFPPALLLCAGILLLHRGKPVRARVLFALLLPLLFGAMAHLLFDKTGIDLGMRFGALLYQGGKAMECGGLIAGLLAILMESAFSIYGAFPVLFLSFLLLALLSVNLTPSRIAEDIKNRPRREYVPQPEPERHVKPPRQKEPRPAEAELPAEELSRRQPRHAIDIPLDGEEETEVKRRDSFFDKKPRVRTPDQLFQTAAPAAKTAEPTAAVEPLSLEEAAALAGVPAAAVPTAVSAARKEKAAPQAAQTALFAAAAADGAPDFQAAGESVIAEQEIADPPRSKQEQAREAADMEQDIAREIEQSLAARQPEYQYPPVTLLRTGGPNTVDGREEMALNRERLETTLHSFGVSAAITGITRGPTVTRYDLELEAGVKLNKLTNLAGDLALSLGVASVRIAPIPDKISTVGIEVPNKLVSTVYLRDIIDSPAFRNAASRLTFAIGEDIGGEGVVGNISKLPHMLIAGTTGSGKSVCMNSLILSLLYKATPEEVRLIMIDPKMVELGIYNGIPHLFVPVVTDPKKAAGALQWAVVEMLKRYRLFSEAGVRDIAGYNDRQKKEGGATIPQVVIVIDELADLMLVASKEVEESICRVAQMGRASGMHLIIATQRPSADVITGLMKANIPSRIAFAVSSALESRIILDTTGAEKLIGQGDMLYAPLGSGKPRRIQGAFVSDEEREDVINFIKASSSASYSEEILAEIEKAAEDKKNGSGKGDVPAQSEEPQSDYDELLPQAVDVIFETKQASVSMLQRRLKLGYSRAARLIDQMEELGVVGPFEGSKPRQIVITREQWQEMQMIQGTAPTESISQTILDLPREKPADDEGEDAPW